MDTGNAYEDLVGHDDARWAFGTGFHDPLEGMDTTVPAGVDLSALAAYCLMLGDDALIMSHRLQEWCTRAPELEEEVAIANIALDLLGQARLLLTRAGQADGTGRTEDDLAFFRDTPEFRHVNFVERPNGDFAVEMIRLLVFAAWRLALLEQLTRSADPVLSAVAAKGVKEVTYHRDYAARWVVRLGDGTDESHRRTQAALDRVVPLAGELFAVHPIEQTLAEGGVAADPAAVQPVVAQVLDQVAEAGGLVRPRIGQADPAGRDGRHTDALPPLLEELQSVARAHPGATW